MIRRRVFLFRPRWCCHRPTTSNRNKSFNSGALQHQWGQTCRQWVLLCMRGHGNSHRIEGELLQMQPWSASFCLHFHPIRLAYGGVPIIVVKTFFLVSCKKAVASESAPEAVAGAMQLCPLASHTQMSYQVPGRYCCTHVFCLV